ncbi:acyltransferase family protein [Telmatospirillum sp.]|uniref:acyltransferase family protein n=1 Tax=Telmatospirillum sp. TaxID=2079197 RepID=UPI002842065F|nr:acyltransferase family protein [Telmatospirillum sp.]MDR3438215.1 acyltransferase family protein [Telmatospirillum sp.]
MTETTRSVRNHAMDNLRVVIIFLVVVLHGIISYMAYPPPWWYVLDGQNSIVFTYMVLLIDVPIMQIMFFLAGYFVWPSLVKRGPARFILDKIRRIGIPWVFGVLVLAPPIAYLIYYSRKSPMSLTTFWQTDFWGKAYQQSVYWYLGPLLALFAVTAILFATSHRFAAWKPGNRRPAWWWITLFVLAMSAVSAAIASRCDLDLWSNNYLFVYQPVRIPNYIGYFFLGIFAFQSGWFTETGFQPHCGLWVPLWVVSALAYVMFRLSPQSAAPTVEFKTVAVLLFNLFCIVSLFAMIALAHRYANCSSAFWRLQARNSYGVYYLHPLILYPLALLFVPLTLSIFLKATLIILVAYVISLAASGLVLTRLPALRNMF